MLISTKIRVDGVDITPYIAQGGVQWSRNDVDGPNAGRNINGDMIRDRVGTKIRLDIKCRPLRHDEHSALMQLLMPEFVQVRYDDPVYGVVTKTMYANNHKSTFMLRRSNGTEWWDSVSFPLIER